MPTFHPSRTRTPRVTGFDDTPFNKSSNAPVPIAGVVCAGARCEGLLWGQVIHDGLGATATALSLARSTDTGHVPEALCPAHLIDGTVITGERARRA